jgi:hypothetical protein
MCHARPALHTVFSTTQLGHSILLLSIHAITVLEMLLFDLDHWIFIEDVVKEIHLGGFIGE